MSYKLPVLLLLSVSLMCVALPAQDLSQSGERSSKQPEDQQRLQDQKELQSFSFTMDSITRWFQANHDLGELTKAHPELAKSEAPPDTSSKYTSLDRIAAWMSNFPPVVQSLAKHGFTPKQYMVASLCFVGMVQDPGMINSANIKLLESHKEELEALAKKYPLDK